MALKIILVSNRSVAEHVNVYVSILLSARSVANPFSRDRIFQKSYISMFNSKRYNNNKILLTHGKEAVHAQSSVKMIATVCVVVFPSFLSTRI